MGPRTPRAQQTPADLSAKMASLHSRIQKERKILEGFQAMRAATSNQDVIRTCEAKMRESAKTIGWFEQSLQELQGRAHDGTGRSSSPAGSLEQSRNRNLPPPPPGAAPSYQQQQSGYAQEQQQRISPTQDVVKPKVNYTSLGELSSTETRWKAERVQANSLKHRTDLIKADTPLTSAKISRMLHQLEFKLHVERQYKEGIDKMAKLYLVDGDKKARSVVGSTR